MNAIISSMKKIIIAFLLITTVISIFSHASLAVGEGEAVDDTYTVDDIVFNRVPIFDVNIFKENAAGKEIRSGSFIENIRNAIAVWYVSFRNIAAIIMVLLLIYAGIRMAISTVASDRAQYKNIMIGWVKGIILLFTIHYMMVAIINLNEMFVSAVSDAIGNPGIYETIKTRAYDWRLAIGIPSAIMYCALIVIWLRFIWIYLKRTFSVFIMIIVAPFISVKYTIDSVNGARGSSFGSWLKLFSTTVAIQSVHAITYVLLMNSAIDMAGESILGFVIGLFFMNFVLQATNIFGNLFKFEGTSVKSLQDKFEKAVVFAGVYEARKVYVKPLVFLGKEVSKPGKAIVKKTIDTIDRIDTNLDKNNRPTIKKRYNSVVSGIENVGASIEKGALNLAFGGTDLYKNKVDEINNRLVLRRISRMKVKQSDKAKKLLKVAKEEKKKRFKAKFNIVRDTTVGTIALIATVPVMVGDVKKGLYVLAEGHARLDKVKKATKSNTIITTNKLKKAEDKINEDYKKGMNKVNQTAKYVSNTNKSMTRIENMFTQLDDEEKTKAKDELEKLDKMNINSLSVAEIIKDYIYDNGITSLDKSSFNDIMNEVIRKTKLDSNEDIETINMIEAEIRKAFESNDIIQLNYMNDEMDANSVETINKISEVIQESIINNTIGKNSKDTSSSEKLRKIAREFNELKNENNRYIENGGKEDDTIKTNRFAQSVGNGYYAKSYYDKPSKKQS